VAHGAALQHLAARVVRPGWEDLHRHLAICGLEYTPRHATPRHATDTTREETGDIRKAHVAQQGGRATSAWSTCPNAVLRTTACPYSAAAPPRPLCLRARPTLLQNDAVVLFQARHRVEDDLA
jgi:hypothetical protein